MPTFAGCDPHEREVLEDLTADIARATLWAHRGENDAGD